MQPLSIKFSKNFVRSNSNFLFVFGESLRQFSDYADDVTICRYEPNCMGVITCICFDILPEQRIFTPSNFDAYKWRMETDIINIKHIKKHYEKVYVTPKFGKGNSLMFQKTPEYYEWLIKKLKQHVPEAVFL